MKKPISKIDVRMEVPNDSILDAAQQFSSAAEKLEGSLGVLQPLVVSYTFAIELYLKALQAEEFIPEEEYVEYETPDGTVSGGYRYPSIPKQTHSLADLVNNLDEIEASQFQKLTNTPISKLIAFAEQYSNLFVQARYPYEYSSQKNYNLSSLKEFHGLVKEFALNVTHRLAYKNAQGKYENVTFITRE